MFTELQSHYLFEDGSADLAKATTKAKSKDWSAMRAELPRTIPVFESFEALNAYLLECCRRRMADCLRSHDETIGERLSATLPRERRCLRLTTPARRWARLSRRCRWCATGSTTLGADDLRSP